MAADVWEDQLLVGEKKLKGKQILLLDPLVVSDPCWSEASTSCASDGDITESSDDETYDMMRVPRWARHRMGHVLNSLCEHRAHCKSLGYDVHSANRAARLAAPSSAALRRSLRLHVKRNIATHDLLFSDPSLPELPRVASRGGRRLSERACRMEASVALRKCMMPKPNENVIQQVHDAELKVESHGAALLADDKWHSDDMPLVEKLPDARSLQVDSRRVGDMQCLEEFVTRNFPESVSDRATSAGGRPARETVGANRSDEQALQVRVPAHAVPEDLDNLIVDSLNDVRAALAADRGLLRDASDPEQVEHKVVSKWHEQFLNSEKQVQDLKLLSRAEGATSELKDNWLAKVMNLEKTMHEWREKVWNLERQVQELLPLSRVTGTVHESDGNWHEKFMIFEKRLQETHDLIGIGKHFEHPIHDRLPMLEDKGFEFEAKFGRDCMNLQEQFEAFEQRIASQLKNFYQASNAFSAQLETLQIPKLAHSVVAECTAALSEKWMLLDTTTSRLAHLEAIGERFVELEARNRKLEDKICLLTTDVKQLQLQGESGNCLDAAKLEDQLSLLRTDVKHLQSQGESLCQQWDLAAPAEQVLMRFGCVEKSIETLAEAIGLGVTRKDMPFEAIAESTLSATPCRVLVAGARVKLFGLSAQHLNDICGVILEYCSNNNRYRIKVDGGRTVAIKPENFQVISQLG